MEYNEFVQEVEKLIFSAEFKELTTALEFREPNIWHILGIPHKEVFVTQFLAWLLDPQSGHSFSNRFLKSLVVRALRTDLGRQTGLTAVEIAVADLTAVQVHAEYYLGRRRCDILAFSERDGFVCVIENKIGAKESKDQTKDYYEQSLVDFLQQDYPKRVYIYLSPDGAPPMDAHFIPLSYQAVLDAVNDLQTAWQATDTELFLLRQFQESLLRSVAMDQKTIDLAQDIYERHQKVIDFINEYVEQGDKNDSAIDKRWDGKSWFFNIGEMSDGGYSWEDSREYSFICAGGGVRYRRVMENFNNGDIVYAYVSGSGYVGIGEIIKAAVPFREAVLVDGRKLTDLSLRGNYNSSEDYDLCDWVALVEWKSKVEKNKAVRLSPITRSTSCRIYEHRKDFVNKVRRELKKRSD